MSDAVRSQQRVEQDTMGEITVPQSAYYGAQTARARENFPLSSLRFDRRFIKALGLIKAAAAQVNVELQQLDPIVGNAIVQAATEVAAGQFDQEFVVDVFQSGSGTSTNMNANEVIANRALEILGEQRGDRARIHPNDHVNKGQSTNDTFPTVIHLATLAALEEHLLPAVSRLHKALHTKAVEFADVIKAGRTHLQDAVPMTLGQEFSGYSSVIEHNRQRIERAKHALRELPIGGTALGTGLNTHPQFAQRVIRELNRVTGLSFRRAENAFEAMQNRDACVEVSAALKTLAVGLWKICNDLRLLASGPYTGLNEIALPAVQPGSSIMPGKVNPVIPEAVMMVAAQVMGNDTTITLAAANGTLDLNVMMPILAYTLLQSVELSANATQVLAEKCVAGITANQSQCLTYAERSAALVTALAPVLGYDEAARVYKIALAQNTSIREVLVEEGALSREQTDEILDLRQLTRLPLHEEPHRRRPG